MSKNETVVVNQNVWTEITDNDMTIATFQVTGANDVFLSGTVGAVVPAKPYDGLVYQVGDGEASRTMADLFPGVGATRLYAKSRTANSKIFIIHD